MNKAVVAILAVLIVGGGGAAYMLTREDDTSTESSNSTGANDTNDTEKKSNDAPEFNPLATIGESFTANMSIESTDGTGTFTGVIDKDADGNTKFSGEQDGETIEFYLTTDGKYIVCEAGECFSLTGGDSPIAVSDFTATDEDIAKYKETASFKGEVDCLSGRCDSWEYQDEVGDLVTIYIDQDSKKVSEVRGTDEDGSKVVITYEYKDVTITLPENVQEIPGGI